VNATSTRRTVATAAGAVAAGTVAARLARLEARLGRPAAGDPLVIVFEDRDGGRETRGVIGAGSRVLVIGQRPDGPQ
jgi:hypothetical protein